MSRLIVILLVILIPLHGWSAESMAFRMAYSQAVAEVAGEPVSVAGMSADCPMLAQAGSKAEEPSGASKGSAGCQTCQLCMTLGSLGFPQTQLAAFLIEVHPEPANARFISADLPPQVKPPILSS
jgi:hypothetical protein